MTHYINVYPDGKGVHEDRGAADYWRGSRCLYMLVVRLK